MRMKFKCYDAKELKLLDENSIEKNNCIVLIYKENLCISSFPIEEIYYNKGFCMLCVIRFLEEKKSRKCVSEVDSNDYILENFVIIKSNNK